MKRMEESIETVAVSRIRIGGGRSPSDEGAGDEICSHSWGHDDSREDPATSLLIAAPVCRGPSPLCLVKSGAAQQVKKPHTVLRPARRPKTVYPLWKYIDNLLDNFDEPHAARKCTYWRAAASARPGCDGGPARRRRRTSRYSGTSPAGRPTRFTPGVGIASANRRNAPVASGC
jgi:hypothetical protein